MNKYGFIAGFLMMSVFCASGMDNKKNWIEKMPREVQDYLISFVVQGKFIESKQGAPLKPLAIDNESTLKLADDGSLQKCIKNKGWFSYIRSENCKTLIQSINDIAGVQNYVGIFSLSQDKKRIAALRDGKQIITFELDNPSDEKIFSLDTYASNEGSTGTSLTSDRINFLQQNGFSLHRKPIKQLAVSNNGEYLIFANDNDVFLSVNQEPYTKINQETDKLIKAIGFNKAQSLIGWKYAEHANASGSYKLPEYQSEAEQPTSMREHFKKIGVKKDLQNIGSKNR